MAYVIVGGGISAVSCAQELRSIDDSAEIIVISASPLLKVVFNCVKVVILANGEEIGYTKLCIATGGRPKVHHFYC
ncbi:unnamed protein product [Dracunculus medinensis]|uniref:Pyr_redox_2 domain-containing protein n=1 Tax=Dracunculus medinensis TaxID=318479 RepID=A0A0N4UNX4_DRAME|nr:unnamed protein product [Dracunculus medinensis]